MSTKVIWERSIDTDKIERRRQTFRKRFFGPAVAILLVVLIFAGVKNAIGALIVLAVVGMAWGKTVQYQSLSDQANPTIVFDGEHLKVGNRDIRVADVKRYTALATSIQTSILGKYSRIHLGKAVFRLDEPGTRRDPQLVEFGWPNMDETGVESIVEALRPVLGDRWVDPGELLNEDELGGNRRRRRPGLI